MAEQGKWKCGWCGAPSHAPKPNELITCPKCGTNGVVEDNG
jgi:DNA-directed RNA polymerase subunit RPC12/RpoP